MAEWTVMVYMAADNNLAVSGIQDLDEMEAAGVDPKVQVVVQAEFSPSELQQYQCNASCFNRPNFNTFRYAVTGQGASVTGPNGTAQDIGNRNMTDPSELASFIQYAKQTYPANHYMLVLWNHGGGYTGLLQDQTSAGSGLMTLAQLKTALTGVGPIDVLDFDMCLMGAYETLATIQGLANYAVFSEEVVPGEGNPYNTMIDGIQANATAAPQAIAGVVADAFHASYQGNKASTTISAYDLNAFAAFETALDNLAVTLRANLATLATDISGAAAASQKYNYVELTDLVDFLDSLNVRVSDPTVQSQIAALKAQATSVFRIRNHVRTGTGSGQQGGAADVTRSTGLTIVLPSGVGQDQFSTSGNQSLANYQALLPNKPWTLLLTDYAGGQSTTGVFDQGNARFEAYLIWDSNAIPTGADVDFWVLEPDGNIYLPALGSVSPNGTFTNDSYKDALSFEGYLTNRYVQVGSYSFYANLWQDPQGFQPQYDLAYRADQVSAFQTLNSPNPLPTLSLTTSWLNDPTPTLAEADAGAYTDLQLITVGTFPAPPAPLARGLAARRMAASSLAAGSHRITAAQFATLRSLLANRRAMGANSTLKTVPPALSGGSR
jgi:hypothetical protein